jgi:hypothetical protein
VYTIDVVVTVWCFVIKKKGNRVKKKERRAEHLKKGKGEGKKYKRRGKNIRAGKKAKEKWKKE